MNSDAIDRLEIENRLPFVGTATTEPWATRVKRHWFNGDHYAELNNGAIYRLRVDAWERVDGPRL